MIILKFLALKLPVCLLLMGFFDSGGSIVIDDYFNSLETRFHFDGTFFLPVTLIAHQVVEEGSELSFRLDKAEGYLGLERYNPSAISEIIEVNRAKSAELPTSRVVRQGNGRAELLDNHFLSFQIRLRDKYYVTMFAPTEQLTPVVVREYLGRVTGLRPRAYRKLVNHAFRQFQPKIDDSLESFWEMANKIGAKLEDSRPFSIPNFRLITSRLSHKFKNSFDKLRNSSKGFFTGIHKNFPLPQPRSVLNYQ